MGTVRIIPTLLLDGGGLVKTKRFTDPTYIGDPINAVRIFNEKEVDELILLDITATQECKAPDFSLIENIVSESFMPICYGGGIKTVEDAGKLFRLGIDKVAINTAASENISLIRELASRYGNQSIVASIDYKKNIWGKQKVFSHSGKKNTGLDPVEFARSLEEAGAGEIVFTSIDKEGMMQGYDIELIKQVCDTTSVPIIANGGAGELVHFHEAIKAGASAVAAGSMFVYHGKLRGILINYPNKKELYKLLNR